ncbi:methylmalonyl-CoA mutase subunit beta [Cytobacillus stercorigallinarum]|nr:methylmalonyl-CoA mutase subunit beta [Cytobacillus stercorigallinarum]
MRNETFAKPTLNDWQEKAKESLKGGSIDRLSTVTYEGIKLKPLYSREDLPSPIQHTLPGSSDFRRGYSSSGYLEEEWYISQRLSSTSAKEVKRQLLEELNKGQSAVSLNPDLYKLSEVEEIVEGLEEYPLCLMTENSLLDLYKTIGQQNWKGFIGKDPLASLMKASKGYDHDWLEAIVQAKKSSPQLKTILIQTTIYHELGANAVQELAIAIASAVSHIERLLSEDFSIEEIVDKVVFHFAIGAHFFTEISKLRAAKILWYKVLEAYGLNEENMNMTISAQTSPYTKTLYDPYVNLLRAGNEAFAAILGGINYLHVSPFDEPSEDSSLTANRIARNTQLILREEAHLNKVVDPAGGSYYIESMTNQIAERAWDLFLAIEDQGGMEVAIETAWIQEQITHVQKKRLSDIFTRKQSIIGTNKYANLDELPLKNAVTLGNRLSIPYEKLRYQVETMKANGVDTQVGLLCLGDLKKHKARMDFVTGFLAPGGIRSHIIPIIHTENLKEQIENNPFSHYVICGANDQYDDSLLTAAKIIMAEKQREFKLYLAGQPTVEEQKRWKEAGVTEFFHMKSDCYHILSTIVEDWEGEVK